MHVTLLLLRNQYNSTFVYRYHLYKVKIEDNTYYAVSRHASRAGRARSQAVAVCIALVSCRFFVIISFHGGHHLTVARSVKCPLPTTYHYNFPSSPSSLQHDLTTGDQPYIYQ